jgi:hypothetical protein
MTGDQAERGAGAGLRGRLSELYFRSVLQGELEPFLARLGDRASVDEPTFGYATGVAAIEARLRERASALRDAGASYAAGQCIVGADRDVTEGLLTVKLGGRTVEVPVAVVAERRASREVELRVYYPSPLLGAGESARRPLARNVPTPLPALVADHVGALRSGNVEAALACFEQAATLREPSGREHHKASGELAAYLSARGRYDARSDGYADDGHSCALEYTVVERAGVAVPAAAPSLAVFERGDSGLFRAVRLYAATPA